ncbi:hypothetical protein HRI_002489400 [Hibiscus trionum]|uniref:TF-B3 domain-containing protein n=1 Tax=Hibiscus trionum TaxID=183268 RepID=A0A9W7I3F2_HIBTR|nr:hypothetical protein HRI_002489400 [Hibiscus trionum]
MGVPQPEADQQIFSKRLTKTDVGVRLSFPMEALNDFEFPRGEDKVVFDVTDGMGSSWKFGLSKRNEARHSHPKPVLSSGWRAYVQAKGLKMGDRVVLYHIKGQLVNKTRFKVRAERKVGNAIKLFGKEIQGETWVDVEKLKTEVRRMSKY